MAKKSQEGQLETAPEIQVDTPEIEEVEPQAPQEPQTPDVPEKWKGKSVMDVAKSYEELEQKLGNQANELGELRNTVSNYDRLVQQYYASQQRPQAGYGQPQAPSPSIEFDYDKPVDSVKRVIQQELAAVEQKRQYEDLQRTAKDAYANFEEGKRHMGKNKKLFEGIEGQVADNIRQIFLSSGGNIPPSKLRDPESWELIARNIRFQRGEYDRITPPKTSPASPTYTESPDAVRRTPEEKTPINFSDADRNMLRYFQKEGYVQNEEEVAELMRKEREMKE